MCAKSCCKSIKYSTKPYKFLVWLSVLLDFFMVKENIVENDCGFNGQLRD